LRAEEADKARLAAEDLRADKLLHGEAT